MCGELRSGKLSSWKNCQQLQRALCEGELTQSSVIRKQIVPRSL